MKVLIDPISTNDPSYCSCHFKMQTMMQYVLERRDDVVFYYLLPDPERSKFEVDKDWLLQHERVHYVPVAQDSDRMREYARLPPEVEDAVAFNGSIWDWDVLITARSTQVGTMRMWMTRSKRHWSRYVIVEDEFPIMSFKSRVNQPHPDSGDLQSIAGYLAADKALIFSMASKVLILKTAKTYLTPSRVRELDGKLLTSISRKFDGLETKPESYVKTVAEGGKTFTMAYTQRLSGKTNRQDDVLDTFFRQYALHGGEDRMRLLLTSNSKVVDRYQEDERFGHLDVRRCPREEFWRLMREEVDVCMAMSPDEDYPLSLIEPVTFGVPLIVLDAPYVRPTFGADYPFIVNGPVQAYGMARAFAEDYTGMYEKFRQWFEGWFRPEMERRNGLWFPYQIMDALKEYEARMTGRLAGSANGVVADIRKYAADKGLTTFDFDTGLAEMQKEKRVNHLYDVFRKDRVKLSYSMATNFNEYRQSLIFQHGWSDHGTEVGKLTVK